MIDFHVDLIRKTNERFATSSTTADRQCSDAKSAYDTVKAALSNKISSVQADIGTADGELLQANEVLSHNMNLAEKKREIIRKANAKKEQLRSSRSKLEARLAKLENMVSIVRALPRGKNTDSTISNIQSRITDVRCDIAEIDRDIEAEDKKINEAEAVLRRIESANQKLQQIISSIQQSIVRMKQALESLKKHVSNITECKKNFDEKYAARKRTMQAIHERTEKALGNASSALRYFYEAGCGSSKEVTVESPSVISNLAMQIAGAASKVSYLSFELVSDAERYRSYLRDNISRDSLDEAVNARRLCEAKANEWDMIHHRLNNAAYQLKFYLECKL